MESYYLKQAGDGLPIQTFAGVKYQRGSGFFGRVFATHILPILRYLGSQALGTGKAILEDIKTSATNRVIDTVNEVAKEAIKRKLPRKEEHQSGSGAKRQKRNANREIYDFLK